jgi:hypothetical protein
MGIDGSNPGKQKAEKTDKQRERGESQLSLLYR